jgi:3,4-dihydroxy 2-butanone 4-phosphate synthase|tara:strand:+ start:5180 stop:5890 length:711 start_codon:yes stop_codon:yes gene_type:complete
MIAENMIDVKNITKILREGKPILVFDEANREGETDIFFSAKYVTHSSINFLRKNGGGMIFLAAENRASTELGLPFAEEIYEEAGKNKNKFEILKTMLSHTLPYDKRSSFSVFLNHKDTFTGISDNDRALTARIFAQIFEDTINSKITDGKNYLAQNFRIPGHVPVCIADSKLLKSRQGHTELIVALFNLIQMNPIALGCEMVGNDGSSLSPEDAKSWAQKEGYLFLEGQQIVDACQ